MTPRLCVCVCVAQQDAAISIAVIHHFATPERRLQAVHEMVRVIRRGGRGLIAVWAFEQAKASHHEQDVFVPWHLKPPAQPKAPRAKQPPRAKRRRATPADEPTDSSDSTTTATTTATTTSSDEPASCSGSSEAVQEPLSVRAVQDGPCIAQGEAITTTQATFQVYQRCVPAGAPGLPSHRIALQHVLGRWGCDADERAGVPSRISMRHADTTICFEKASCRTWCNRCLT